MKKLKKLSIYLILIFFCTSIVSSCGIKGAPKPPPAKAKKAKKR